jgi:hypothetical protein
MVTASQIIPSAISYTEIKSFLDLMSVRPEEWEIDLIDRFDMTVRDVMREQQERAMKNNNKK